MLPSFFAPAASALPRFGSSVWKNSESLSFIWSPPTRRRRRTNRLFACVWSAFCNDSAWNCPSRPNLKYGGASLEPISISALAGTGRSSASMVAASAAAARIGMRVFMVVVSSCGAGLRRAAGLLHQPFHDARIGERGDVPQVVVLPRGDLAQDAPHDLSGAGLGQAGHDLHALGHGEGPDLFAHVLLQGAAQLLGPGPVGAGDEADEGVDPGPLDRVREADHRGLGHRLVRHQSALDLGRAQAVARHVEHIVHAAGDPVVAVLVPAAAVAREVQTGRAREVGFPETLVIAPQRARHAGPGTAQAEIPGDVVPFE